MIGWEVVNLNKIISSMYISFITLLILNMLIIFFGVYSYFFNVDDYTLIAGIIAFFGAIIGGSITLVGVSNTIQENRRKDNQEKYERASYLFVELLPFINKVYSSINSLNEDEFNSKKQEVIDCARNLWGVATNVSNDSWKINLDFHTELKSVQYYSERIYELLEDESSEKEINDLYKELLVFYRGLAGNDTKMHNIVNGIKHS